MITIIKNEEPECLKEFKKKNPDASYQDIDYSLRDCIRSSLLKDQGFICCFCGERIGKYNGNTYIEIIPSNKDRHNIRITHILPQSKFPKQSLDYKNMYASCDTQKENSKNIHCDEAQKNRIIPISPQTNNCIKYFKFSIDGEILPSGKEGSEEYKKALETISILNLNDTSLKSKRKQAISKARNIMLYSIPKEVYFASLSKKNAKNAFSRFYFVILRHFNRL